MVLYWNAWAMPAFVIGAGTWALATVTYRANPTSTRNRLLAATLALEGTVLALFGLMLSLDSGPAAYAARTTEWVAVALTLGAYLPFLGTLDTPLSRPLGTRTGRVLLAGGSLVSAALLVARTERFLAGVTTTSYSRWEVVFSRTGVEIGSLVVVLIYLFGALVAASYVRRSAPGSRARSRAWTYLAAFGIRDLTTAASFAVAIGVPYLVDIGPTALFAAWYALWIVGLAAYAALLAYGFLKHQLFDIDLKVKASLKHGTVVGAVVGAYILTSLGARAFMPAGAAQTTGIVLTGLLLFALVPLQRFGGRVADAAMPGVRDDEAYLDQRRIEVYQAALEEALTPEGELPRTREAPLARLRGRMGLTDRDHALLLHAVRGPGRSTVGPSFEPGRVVLSRYRIEELLGKGGQGTTYKALDTTLGREVVLKALHGPDSKRVLQEARALAAISDPNVVAIHDVERVGDHVYLVMEHVDGGSLKEQLQAGAVDAGAFHRLADDLLAGLQAVHDAGLVHRDVKPSNVLLTLDGTAKLADLGIATTAEPSDQTTLGAGSTGARGTVAYMSPEQARGDKLTSASDLFSAAATLYEAYTGRALFERRPGESPVELQARVAGWTGFEAELDDRELQAWFSRALAAAPEDRYPVAVSMREGLADLGAAVDGRPAATPPGRLDP